MKSIDYKSIIKKKPPWELSGDGYIFIYRFPKNLLDSFDLDQYQNNRILSVGALFLVDYKDSPVGPYHEILIAPGIFKMGKFRRFSISKILVSSMESVVNGVNNWGIPKELASFKRVLDGKHDTWSIHNGDFELNIKLSHRGFKFPLSTSIMPLKLAQELDNNLVLTTATAKGRGRLAKILELDINGEFPLIQDLKPILGLKVDDFAMFFKTPTTHLNFFK